jgi:hypothetical protein
MRLRTFVFLSSIVTACVWSCTDLGGLSGGGGSGTTDAAVAESGVSDAGTDASPDASSEAGCARRVDASFCVDFEGSDPIGLGTWTAVDEANGKGAIELVQDASTSPPNAASIRSVAAGTCYNLALRKSFPGTYSGGKVIASVLPDGNASTLIWRSARNGVLYLLFGDITPTDISLNLQSYSTEAGTQVLAYGTAPLPSSPIGKWSEVQLSFESSPTRLARFRVGKVEATAAIPNDFPLDDPSLEVGQWCTDPGRTVLADDIGVWLTP